MEYLIGAVLGLGLAAFARGTGLDRFPNYLPIVLIVVASYYVLFAAMGGSLAALGLEVLLFGAFALLALIGFRSGLWWAVLGLFAHGLQDAFHSSLWHNAGVPSWWPGFCLAIDVTLGTLGSLAIWSAPPRQGMTGDWRLCRDWHAPPCGARGARKAFWAKSHHRKGAQ